MKILVNVAREVFDEEWVECEGVQFREQKDGSFDIVFARDLAAAREADERLKEIHRKMDALAKGGDRTP